MFQAPSLFEHLTAVENVILAPLHVARTDRSQAIARAVELLESLGVAHRRNAFPRELSGGEAQRVAIARAMAMEPPLLMMDEPTAALDPARRFELGETLVRLTREGRTLLVTTHDDDFARDFATRVIILADGEIVEEGAPREVLTNPKHPATKALLKQVLSAECCHPSLTLPGNSQCYARCGVRGPSPRRSGEKVPKADEGSPFKRERGPSPRPSPRCGGERGNFERSG